MAADGIARLGNASQRRRGLARASSDAARQPCGSPGAANCQRVSPNRQRFFRIQKMAEMAARLGQRCAFFSRTMSPRSLMPFGPPAGRTRCRFARPGPLRSGANDWTFYDLPQTFCVIFTLPVSDSDRIGLRARCSLPESAKCVSIAGQCVSAVPPRRLVTRFFYNALAGPASGLSTPYRRNR